MKKRLLLVAMELLILVAYAFFAVMTYQEKELVFTEDDMLLQDSDAITLRGG